MNKKERERRNEEPERDQIIADLKLAIEGLVSGRKKPEDFEGTLAEAKALAYNWKDPRSAKDPKDRRPLFGEVGTTKTNFFLAGLVVALEREIEVLKRETKDLAIIRAHYPKKLHELIDESRWADALAWLARLREAGELKAIEAKIPPKRRKDIRRRSKIRLTGGGELQQAFGKAYLEGLLGPVGVTPRTPILDRVLGGELINIEELEQLFGLNRKSLFGSAKALLKENLPFAKRRKWDKHYGGAAVLKLLDALLKREPRTTRKRSKRGAPRKNSWVDRPDARKRGLDWIQAQIKEIAGLLVTVTAPDADLAKLTDEEIAIVRTIFENFRGYPEWQQQIANPFLGLCRSDRIHSGNK